ncbi:MAG TPA: DUF2147 domain-containing protein [Xanthomonadaceae bacterium]|jgi:uncharacterized protein (DUF2147 family)|nr:DUF2147 domain-containing protein [Xanthomonadaceae bacterium]
MRKILLIAATGLLGLLPCASMAQDMNSPVGVWKTIDDKTGKAKSLVKIFEVNGKLSGQVIEVYPLPGEDPDPICDKCTGGDHNKKIKGLVIMWGFTHDGDVWDGGHIFDPQKQGSDEDPYKAKLTVIEGGQSLIVRGYLGFSWIGRSQTWHRVVDNK